MGDGIHTISSGINNLGPNEAHNVRIWINRDGRNIAFKFIPSLIVRGAEGLPLEETFGPGSYELELVVDTILPGQDSEIRVGTVTFEGEVPEPEPVREPEPEPAEPAPAAQQPQSPGVPNYGKQPVVSKTVLAAKWLAQQSGHKAVTPPQLVLPHWLM